MKRIATILLLILVAAAILSTYTKEDSYDVENKKPLKASIVYYLHGAKRCATCNKLESYAKETLDQNFAQAMQSGKLFWQSTNYEEAKYEHFVKEFDLSYQMIVLARYEDGKLVRHKKLDKVWKLVNDKDAYQKYIKGETSAFFGNLIK